MKLIIAGGRKYQFTKADYMNLYKIRKEVTEVVSGHSGYVDKETKELYGADLYGEAWASTYGIPVKKFIANWGKYGKSAGPMRNQAMAAYADALAVFPGGKGTKNMLLNAQNLNLRIYRFDAQNEKSSHLP